MKVSMCIYLTDRTKKRVTEIAGKHEVSMTHIIREAIQLYIDCENEVNPCPACGANRENKI